VLSTKFISTILVIVMSLSSLYAAITEREGHVHGVHKECPLPKSLNDITDCAMIFHPSVKRGLLKLNSSKKLEQVAAQGPNPTLFSRYVRGDSNGNETSELEANLSFTFELGGKRDSRKKYAFANKNKTIALNEATKSEVKIKTILSLYRLRQVMIEIKITKEAIRAFSKVIKQLKKLPRLSAQQEGALTLFEISLEETRVNESELFEEERKLEHYFHISTGHSLNEIKGFLPLPPTKWPKVMSQKINTNSPEIKKLKSLTVLAQKGLEVQKADAWPNLRVGPSLAIERVGMNSNKMLGLNIQIPIPIFQTNQGGKAFARSELVKARRNVVLTKTEERHERMEQLRVYKSAVNILNKTMKQSVVEKKHKKIERLYLRGVISSSIFLDSLKQKLSYLKSRNHREITAVKSLWSIYNFDGRVFEEKI
jgi:cobalt-zinc-cadmium efflux system outer membrane protein